MAESFGSDAGAVGDKKKRCDWPVAEVESWLEALLSFGKIKKGAPAKKIGDTM